MLVGHCAVALAGKRAAPRLSLGTLMAAAVLADLLGFVFILLDRALDDESGQGRHLCRGPG
jgi:hypothetical protein